MMQPPPPGPWRPTGPLPPPRARPLPPRPVPRPTAPYPVPPPGPPPRQYGQPPYGPQPGAPQPGPQQYGPPVPPPGYRPGPYPPPGSYPPPGAPPWAQGYPGHPGMLRPRPKSNTGPLIATIIVAVLVVSAGMIGFLTLKHRYDHVADTGYDDPATTTTSSETRTSTETATTTTDAPVTTTTDAPITTTEDTPTETTPAGPQPVYQLADNPLFAGDVGTAAVTCPLKRWQTTPEGAEAFFRSALPCLDAAWKPVLTRAGLPFFSPSMKFPQGTDWSSPCGSVGAGDGAVAAFYCGEDNTLYMPFTGLQTDEYGKHPGVYLAVFAHEYGHHVQAMSGVLDAYAQARYDAGVDTGPGLELSRRLELQAQCFSGMFLAATYGRGSVDDNILGEARSTQDRGDHTQGLPRDHGTDAHTSAWWEQGATKNRTFQCNTWKSPAADVA